MQQFVTRALLLRCSYVSTHATQQLHYNAVKLSSMAYCTIVLQATIPPPSPDTHCHQHHHTQTHACMCAGLCTCKHSLNHPLADSYTNSLFPSPLCILWVHTCLWRKEPLDKLTVVGSDDGIHHRTLSQQNPKPATIVTGVTAAATYGPEAQQPEQTAAAALALNLARQPSCPALVGVVRGRGSALQLKVKADSTCTGLGLLNYNKALAAQAALEKLRKSWCGVAIIPNNTKIATGDVA